ncbi:MAG: toxin-antitoxin system HicB family antitoxin [Mesorhizobium sp.]
MAKTANLALRISPELKAALEAAAKAEERSVSQYIELVLKRHLEVKGLLGMEGSLQAEPRHAS